MCPYHGTCHVASPVTHPSLVRHSPLPVSPSSSSRGRIRPAPLGNALAVAATHANRGPSPVLAGTPSTPLSAGKSVQRRQRLATSPPVRRPSSAPSGTCHVASPHHHWYPIRGLSALPPAIDSGTNPPLFPPSPPPSPTVSAPPPCSQARPRGLRPSRVVCPSSLTRPLASQPPPLAPPSDVLGVTS